MTNDKKQKTIKFQDPITESPNIVESAGLELRHLSFGA
jgi:hypothetical protein